MSVIVTHALCRELGYCNRGMREWCAREGLDWPHFLRHGIDADILRGRHDAMADKVIAEAERDQHGQE